MPWSSHSARRSSLDWYRVFIVSATARTLLVWKGMSQTVLSLNRSAVYAVLE